MCMLKVKRETDGVLVLEGQDVTGGGIGRIMFGELVGPGLHVFDEFLDLPRGCRESDLKFYYTYK